MSIAGLLLSIFVVKDTKHHVQKAQKTTTQNKVKNLFVHTSFSNPNLSATTQAGLVNNLNDGMIWGLLPWLLLQHHYDMKTIGLIVGVYPMVWGLGQLFTGKLADLYSHKKILFWGMLLQGIAICLLIFVSSKTSFLLLCTALGLGTALVYPTFLVVIANNSSPIQRAESIGIFRLWRDLGYAIGALLSGIIADAFGINYAIISIGILTILSALVIQIRLKMP
jgi:MFS family permease